jgi:hypothetical protein
MFLEVMPRPMSANEPIRRRNPRTKSGGAGDIRPLYDAKRFRGKCRLRAGNAVRMHMIGWLKLVKSLFTFQKIQLTRYWYPWNCLFYADFCQPSAMASQTTYPKWPVGQWASGARPSITT